VAEARGTLSNRAAMLVLASVCVAGLGEGVDLQAPGVTLPVLAPLFNMTTGEGQGFLAGFFSEKSLFLSMSTFGLIFGALFGGRLSDIVGRKWVAVLSVALFGVGSAITAHATDAHGLLVWRFVTGLGLGGALPNLVSIVAETIPSNRRTTGIGILYGSMPIGGAMVSFAAFAFSNAEQWPYIFYLGAVMPFLSLPGLILLVPNLKPQRPEGARRESIGQVLFGHGRGGVTVALLIAFFLAVITMHVLLMWLPSLLVARGLTRPEASLVQIGFNLSACVGSVITGFLIERAARTGRIAMVFGAAVVALLALALAPGTFGVSLAVGVLVGATVSGVQAIIYALAPSCYPASGRGTGVGAGVSAGRLGSALGPLVAGALLSSGASPTRVLTLLVPLLLIAGLMSVYISPRATERDDGGVAVH
jgi:AAHS family 3-hydroxyphenylpropionic acid transporter